MFDLPIIKLTVSFSGHRIRTQLSERGAIFSLLPFDGAGSYALGQAHLELALRAQPSYGSPVPGDTLRGDGCGDSRGFPDRMSANSPGRGSFALGRIAVDTDSLDLYRLALAKGVCIAPGPMFSARGEYRNCLALYFGYASVKQIRDGIRTIAKLIGRASF